MRERGVVVRSGETIPYIVCGDARKEGSLAEHSFHPDDVRRDHLVVDKVWYLAQQVHPCVARLCEHLAGTDAGRLATCLGLDSSKYQTQSNNNSYTVGGEDETIRLTAFLSDDERFRNVDRLQLQCPACHISFEFQGLLIPGGDGGGKVRSGLDCSCGQRITPVSFHAQLRYILMGQIAQYYAGWMECDEPACRATTRQLRVYESRCPIEACRGSMRAKYPAQRLYHQLHYYKSLVDPERLKNLTKDSSLNWRAIAAEHEPLRVVVDRYLDRCAYPIIKLGEIFSFVTVTQ